MCSQVIESLMWTVDRNSWKVDLCLLEWVCLYRGCAKKHICWSSGYLLASRPVQRAGERQHRRADGGVRQADHPQYSGIGRQHHCSQHLWLRDSSPVNSPSAWCGEAFSKLILLEHFSSRLLYTISILVQYRIIASGLCWLLEEQRQDTK